MKPLKIAMALAAGLTLAGCLQTDGERALAGAAAGVIAADILDTSGLTGAAVGAAAGALCDDVRLCNPSR